MSDAVNHPSHYNKEGRKECIVEMLEKFGPVAVYWFCVLSSYKYNYRAGDKDDLQQDLDKAHWFDEYATKLKEEYPI